MNSEQVIEIVKAGFPDRVKELIDFDSIVVTHRSGVYSIYDNNNPNDGRIPDNSILDIFIEGDFVQINPKFRAFNHYAAIKKIEELNIV